MKEMNECDIEELRKEFRYDAETGIVERRMKNGWRVKRLTPGNYQFLRFEGKSFLVHRAVWALHYGEWPKMFLDHINGLRHDNRICNLREVTNRQNKQNLHKKPRQFHSKIGEKRSKYIGVSWSKQKERWIAYITTSEKLVWLGSFESEEAAYHVRCEAELKYHTHSPLHTAPFSPLLLLSPECFSSNHDRSHWPEYVYDHSNYD